MFFFVYVYHYIIGIIDTLGKRAKYLQNHGAEIIMGFDKLKKNIHRKVIDGE